MAGTWHDYLADLYREHRRGFLAFAVSITGSQAMGEDAIQEAFARLCRMDQSPPGDPVAYSYQAVRNASLDQRRRVQAQSRLKKRIREGYRGRDSVFDRLRGRRGQPMMRIEEGPQIATADFQNMSDDSGPTYADTADPLDVLVAQESQTALMDAVDQLNDADQQVLLLRVYGGLSIEQIAEAFEQSRTTVSSRYHRALKKLKKQMESQVDSSQANCASAHSSSARSSANTKPLGQDQDSYLGARHA